MTATQSHALTFEDFPATRLALPVDPRARIIAEGDRPGGAIFTAVVTGVVENAIDTARQQLERKRGPMRAYEQVEWSKVELDGWLIQQAYQGLLRAMEQDSGKARNGLLAKEAIAELSESVMTRLCRVVGGSTFSRHSPFGYWFEDVRALGFLRPSWGLAFDRVFEGSWPE